MRSGDRVRWHISCCSVGLHRPNAAGTDHGRALFTVCAAGQPLLRYPRFLHPFRGEEQDIAATGGIDLRFHKEHRGMRPGVARATQHAARDQLRKSDPAVRGRHESRLRVQRQHGFCGSRRRDKLCGRLLGTRSSGNELRPEQVREASVLTSAPVRGHGLSSEPERGARPPVPGRLQCRGPR